MPLPARVDALRDRNVRLLLIGQGLSFLGDQMTPVAISFAILDRGGSARQVGWVLGAGTASMVVFLLLGGVLADRLARRWLMIGADLLRFAAQGTAAGLLVAGHWRIWELVIAEAAWGAGAAAFQPAMTGLLPELVTGERLAQANALYGLVGSAGFVIGPSLAGVLLAAAGSGAAVAVDAATFLVSVATLARLRLPAAAARVEGTGMLRELRDGWHAFWSRPWLSAVVGQYSLWHFAVLAPTIVLGAVVAKQDLGGAAAWGAILSSLGAGSVVGGIVALRWRPSRPLVASSLVVLPFAGVPALLAAVAPVWTIAVCAALGGAGFAVFGALWTTTMQREVPSELLSRVSAYDWLGSEALLPVGYAAAGPVAAVVGTRTTLIGSAVAMFVLTATVLAVPAVRRMGAGEAAVPASEPA